jgi:enoyl-CoA hydratase/carnithine racemase
MADQFLYEKDGAVTTITFNRPERRNCMNQKVMNELESLVRDVRNDHEVRVLIVTGAGAAFSAGADMSAVKGISDRGERASSTVKTEELHEVGKRPARPLAFDFQGAFAGIAA